MLNDIRGAFAFLTVIPMGRFTWGQPGRIFSYVPLVGLVIGVLLYGIAAQDAIPPDLRAFLILTAWVIITGGLHLDGFGDACDGLLATVEPARRLEIMKDSRAGSWAVIGLVVLLLGKWVAVREVSPRDLILPPVIGRWAMVLAVGGFAYARPSGSGVGGYFRTGFGSTQHVISFAITLGVAVIAGWPAGAVILVAPVVVVLIGGWAATRLGGGLTGDVYGALCEFTELVCLIVLGIL